MPRGHLGVAVAGALLAAVVLAAGTSVVWRDVRAGRQADGIPDCPAGAANRLRSHDALQCWFGTLAGRWRIVEQYSAHGALIVHVQATAADDAREIAEQFVAHEGAVLPEILVYVNAVPPGQPPLTRRVRWTRSTGFDVLEFAGASVQ